jgi:diguanylate cyclase (GGDEF)-like protein
LSVFVVGSNVINESDAFVVIGRRRVIQWSNLFVAAFVLCLALFRYTLTGFDQPPYPALFLAVGCLFNTLYLRRGGAVEVSAWILVGLMWVALLFGALNTYGFDGPVVFLAPLVPIISVILVNLRAAIASTVVVTVILVVLWVLGVRGIIPANPHSREMYTFARFITSLFMCVAAVWVVWRFSDATGKLLKEIAWQSKTDYLTGILNRRGVEYILNREVAAARRRKAWVSVIMIDVDHFKIFNDLNGHQAGDECLVFICKKIQKCLNRETDVLGRFGGEEFIVILPEVDLAGASLVAEKIRFAVESAMKPYGGKEPGFLTLTLGIASGHGRDIVSAEQLIKLADQKLYEGKREGRNRVVMGGTNHLNGNLTAGHG